MYVTWLKLQICFYQKKGKKRDRHLKGQLVWGLGYVALYDMSSSNRWNIDGRFFVNQQMIPLIVHLMKTQTQNVHVRLTEASIS